MTEAQRRHYDLNGPFFDPIIPRKPRRTSLIGSAGWMIIFCIVATLAVWAIVAAGLGYQL